MEIQNVWRRFQEGGSRFHLLQALTGARPLKSQANIIMIIAIFILVIVVIFFTTERFLISEQDTGEIANLKRSLKIEIEDSIRSKAFEVANRLGAQGGYLDLPLSTKLGENDVAYWQICQNKILPSLDDIRLNFRRALQEELKNLKLDSFQGKKINLGEVQNTEIIIRPNDIIINVWMPTSIEGFQINQPYKIVLPVELGKAYSFASDFVEENSKNRHISKYLASLLYHAKTERLPTLGLMTRCGDNLFVSREQAEEAANELLTHASLNIVFWKDPPEERGYTKYYIPEVNGKVYDVDVSFHSTEELNRQNFQPSMDPIFISNNKRLWKLIPKCVTGFDIRYTFNPSMVATVETKSGYKFNFGLMPYVVDNKIGRCDSPDIPKVENVCSDAKCNAELEFVDSFGNPVSETNVFYGSCKIGTTIDGKVSGKIPCGISQLTATHPDYNPYADVVSSFELENKKIVLEKNPDINFHFKQLNIINILGFLGTKGKNIATISDSRYFTYIYVKQKDASPWFQVEALITNINDNGENVLVVPETLPPGEYEAEINTIKPIRFYKRFCVKKDIIGDCTRHETIDQMINITSKVKYNFNITEGDTDIYIYAPVPGVSITGDSNAEYQYTSLVPGLERCGIDIISRKDLKGSCEI